VLALIEVAEPRINTFGITPKANVSPSEDVFILTSTQLEEIISRATVAVKAEVEVLNNKIAFLESKVAEVEATQDVHSENDLNQLRLIAELRGRHKPTKSQQDKEKILKALLTVNGGKMPSREARRIMKMDRGNFSRLVSGMSDITTKPYSADKRQTILILK
jgi:hypothetical protein